MISFGKSVNSVVFPEYSEAEVIKSLIKSAQDYRENEKGKRRTALDFYLYQNTERHVQQWFESESLQQVPVFSHIPGCSADPHPGLLPQI